jgi:hypothetical protein
LIAISKTLSSDTLVQRVTVYSSDDKDKSVEEILASGTITSTGATNISWSGDATTKRPKYTINTTDTTLTIDGINLTSVDFTVGGTNPTPSVSYTIYGNKFATAYSGLAGEAINQDNFDLNIGSTIEVINRYVQSDAEAKNLAEKIIERFPASPNDTDFELSITVVGDPRIEVGDRIVIIEANTLTNNVYSVQNISHSFSAENAQYTMQLQLRDIGETLENITWDRNGITEGSEDLEFDTGLRWDLDIFTQSSDTDTYPKKNYVT